MVLVAVTDGVRTRTVVNRKRPDSTTTWSSRWTSPTLRSCWPRADSRQGRLSENPTMGQGTSLIPFYLGLAPAHPTRGHEKYHALNPTG